MTPCYQNAFEFPRVRRRVVEARFNGGELTSDGGSLLLRKAEMKPSESADDPTIRRKSAAHEIFGLDEYQAQLRENDQQDQHDQHDQRERECAGENIE